MLRGSWIFVLEVMTWIVRIVLVLTLVFDAMFVLRCVGALIIGGLRGVHQWIVHVSTMGEPFGSGQTLDEQIRNGYLSLAFMAFVLPTVLFFLQRWASTAAARVRQPDLYS